jgi:predicted phosphodiesterase
MEPKDLSAADDLLEGTSKGQSDEPLPASARGAAGLENFHEAKSSLLQSVIKHILCHGGESRPGLASDHPYMQTVLEKIDSLKHGSPEHGSTEHGSPEHSSLNHSSRSGNKDGLAEACVKLTVEFVWGSLTDDNEAKERVRSQFKDCNCDPGWLSTVTEYLAYYHLEHKQPLYRDVADGHRLIYDLPQPRTGASELVVGLLGDWGTGEPVAEVVLDQLFQHRPDLIVHVGDIYYSGTLEEAQHNFLEPIRAARERHGLEVPVYNLPGNHDYYSGGRGFYKTIDELNITHDQGSQGASFFCLHNEHWQLQGMDTGYFDQDYFKVSDDITRLHDTEATWHQQQIGEAVKNSRRVILLSHHQLFSALLNIGAEKDGNQDGENYNPNLLKVFGDAIDQQQIAAWFWGHEHVLGVYEPYKNLAVGRCIGHSAFPIFKSKNGYQWKYPKVPLKAEIELGTTDRVYDHGYVMLTLGAKKARADYYTVPGNAIPEQSIPHQKIFSETF